MQNQKTKYNYRPGRLIILGVLLIVGLYFAVNGLIEAQAFLAPITIASLLAMMFLPLTRKLERNGMARGWASLVAVLIAFLFFLALFALISMQGRRIANDWPQIEQKLKPRMEQVQKWLASKTGMEIFLHEKELVKELMNGNSAGKSGNKPEAKPSESGKSTIRSAGKAVIKFIGFVGVALLTGVYLFFMLLYRKKIRLSLMRFFPKTRQEEAEQVIIGSAAISQNYLLGRFLLIFILAVLYSIGLAASGVEHAILISFIAALLSLIPYIGNLIGFVLAVAMAAFSGGELGSFIGVAVTFSIAQFVESYILEPYIVGKKVQLNPLMTILVVVLGGAVWGIVGMIVFIPLFGIVKIVCDHVAVLKPVGYMLGEEDTASAGGENSLMDLGRKIKEKLRK